MSEDVVLRPSIELLTSDRWVDYALLDSGNGSKLEQFGAYTFVRPEHQAVWKPAMDKSAWEHAHATFVPTAEESGGRWQIRKPLPDSWSIRYGDLRLLARPSNSRHLGIFPEQAVHWDWIMDQIVKSEREVSVLNLFGYTGAATLAAARVGAKVTHVDASKKSVAWARENQNLSHLENASIRWIVDDAVKFIRREVRRGNRYHGIILDPPKFGRGPKGEVWEFFDMLPELLPDLRRLFSDQPLFLIITAYAIRSSALTLYYALEEMLSGMNGKITVGELCMCEKSAGRQISQAIFGRWCASEAGELAGRRKV